MLELGAEGLTADGIALRLLVTERTIRKHLRCARQILNAQNTTQAVAIAVATQLIKLGFDVAVESNAAADGQGEKDEIEDNKAECERIPR